MNHILNFEASVTSYVYEIRPKRAFRRMLSSADSPTMVAMLAAILDFTRN